MVDFYERIPAKRIFFREKLDYVKSCRAELFRTSLPAISGNNLETSPESVHFRDLLLVFHTKMTLPRAFPSKFLEYVFGTARYCRL